MTFKNLNEFVSYLESIGELKRVKQPVSTVLEMTEIQQRLIQKSGPAILFENVVSENGKNNFPVLVNLFGTVNRVALALNTTPDKLVDLGNNLAFLRQPQPPEGWKEAIKMMKNKFGLSELIQSGILLTLLTIAFSLGQYIKTIDLKLGDHENRIIKLELK